MSLFKTLFSKPLSLTMSVTSANGFHLRPVAQFCTLAKTFPCSLTASFKDKTVDAKAVNALLSLSLEQGDSFRLDAKGNKADKALEALEACFTALMQNDKEQHSQKKSAHHYLGKTIEAAIIFRGVAVACLHHHTRQEHHNKNECTFKEALDKSMDELERLYINQKEEENGTIYLAQKELLFSLGSTSATLSEFEQKIQKESQKLIGTMLDSKRSDYQDILQRTKTHLGFNTEVIFPDVPFIFVSKHLLPSEVDTLKHTKVAGVILQETALNSHTAILLRAAGICAVICDAALTQNETIILDANAGVILQNPSQEDVEKALQRQTTEQAQKTRNAHNRFQRAYTAEGKPIQVLANVSDLASAEAAKEQGAEGIGLLRSEFLFKNEKPSFLIQKEAYESIFALFDDITVRTLDVGGDKALPYITLPYEANPFLGVRGIRLLQTHPEILEEQLHALFAAAQNKPIKIMFPMVSSVEEFVNMKRFAQEIAKKYALDISHLRFGIMIEVPSVLFLLEAFNEVVDFYSIGTNDLTQYLFAIERTHPLLRTDECSPVVFSALEMIMQKATKPVSICGELAANKDALPILLKLGIATLSISPSSIAQTKEEIRHA
ncbi:MAG TPA: HPr family phosphocarrier protein [Sulfurovum sp.]|jgi:phosphocarrier protein FPr|nr:MAG: PTS fructose transporter subunit IIBC [Sulfurovum sp. 35-42-20]OYY56194.1 MAG: PTS fructose transporter subunit IIBC [Sulfurovum sp. 28-43-6]OYZ25268.1 MAG: PTS fructose transporter subunit IIBC [Sulfurovum sp. 16-42-52]OYZ50057.1 MAG: PTS fructose transporter subunit IIBC [Sulfurovum sp. 24-42-9]OZA45300.1 MAG: PTS fructose transporter subunit IIBC [Sulfurovum sp. 17-42-90]OZA60576.1 MAG: PTS fructose transporter subunit IIBC [Sulfurovum sp. 39-42-12]HQR72948.1 HPr family phosphocarr